jgi:hypothetical protein
MTSLECIFRVCERVAEGLAEGREKGAEAAVARERGEMAERRGRAPVRKALENTLTVVWYTSCASEMQIYGTRSLVLISPQHAGLFSNGVMCDMSERLTWVRLERRGW